jgi:hypothetical protein
MLRKWMQHVLLAGGDLCFALAMRLEGIKVTKEELPPQPGLPFDGSDEEEDDDLPLGHPVVTLSPKAKEMIAPPQPKREVQEEPEKPLHGSLAARRQNR